MKRQAAARLAAAKRRGYLDATLLADTAAAARKEAAWLSILFPSASLASPRLAAELLPTVPSY